MSESSDETREPDDSKDDSKAEDVQTLRRQVEEKYDFSQNFIYAV